MAFIFNLIMYFLLVLFIMACVTAWRIYRSFRNVADSLKGSNGNARKTSQRRDTYGNASADDIIIDRRTSDKANRKIFSEDEGEYVDFEEEK